MENGGIPRLDNVILCGEDNSENLVLSFYGTFPEANVTDLKFDGLDLTEYFHPSICTVKQPLIKMAEESVNMILELIEGGDNRNILLATELIIRDACK